MGRVLTHKLSTLPVVSRVPPLFGNPSRLNVLTPTLYRLCVFMETLSG